MIKFSAEKRENTWRTFEMTQNNGFPLKFSVFFLFVRLEDWNQVCHLPYVWKNHHQVVWRNRVPKRVEIELAHSFNRPDVISSGPQDFRMSNCSKNYSITRQWKRDFPQKMPANIKVTEKTVFIKGDIIISLNNWIKEVAENISFLLKIKYFRAIVLHRRSSLFFSYLDWY